MFYFIDYGKGSRLVNVHDGLSVSSQTGGQQYLIQGSYEYYHYLQDKMNDKVYFFLFCFFFCFFLFYLKGWGCAYRSLQTICSWFRRQGYTSKPDPTFKQIQETLVQLGDKPPAFINSSKWIGAFELSLCLDQFYEVPDKFFVLNFYF